MVNHAHAVRHTHARRPTYTRMAIDAHAYTIRRAYCRQSNDIEATPYALRLTAHKRYSFITVRPISKIADK